MKKRFARFMSGKRIQSQRRRLGMFLIEQGVANGDRDWEQFERPAGLGRVYHGDFADPALGNQGMTGAGK